MTITTTCAGNSTTTIPTVSTVSSIVHPTVICIANPKTIDFITKLPQRPHNIIFSGLDRESLQRASVVSKTWHTHINEDTFNHKGLSAQIDRWVNFFWNHLSDNNFYYEANGLVQIINEANIKKKVTVFNIHLANCSKVKIQSLLGKKDSLFITCLSSTSEGRRWLNCYYGLGSDSDVFSLLNVDSQRLLHLQTQENSSSSDIRQKKSQS